MSFFKSTSVINGREWNAHCKGGGGKFSNNRHLTIQQVKGSDENGYMAFQSQTIDPYNSVMNSAAEIIAQEFSSASFLVDAED